MVVKIFALPSHQTEQRTSGVDFARVIQPMKHLDGFEYEGVTFKTDIYDIHAKKKPNWIDVSKEYDIVFLNYVVFDWEFAAMGAPLRGEGKKMVYDIDDAIWYVRKDNPTYDQFHANNGRFIYNIECHLNEVDHITTTSPYLRNILVNKTRRRHDEMTVIPNCIDLDLYKFRGKVKDDGTITIMHYGSTTHFEDMTQKPFMDGLTKIIEEFPNVNFVTVGAFMPEYRYKFGPRYINEFGHIDIYGWIKEKFPTFMEQADIVVSPLEIDYYNRSKSFIKFLEYSSAKRPGVYQDIDQYRQVVEHGKNGYLASSSDDWYNYLKELILDVKKREKIGNSAFKTAKEYQMKDFVKEYAKVFVKVLDIS